jgi:hypothetical protein
LGVVRAPGLVCIGCGCCATGKGGSTSACRVKSNGPNLLDELLSGFIWFSGVWA